MEAHVRSAPADYYLGMGLALTRHPEEAAVSLEKCLGQQPTDSVKQRAYYQLVNVYQALHRQDDARRAAEEMKRLKAASPNTEAEAEHVP